MPSFQKRGAEATPAGSAKRIATLRASSPSGNTKAGLAKFNPDRPLTEQQKKFALLWANGESPNSAAVKAGYATSCATTVAWKLRQDPAVLRIYNAEKLKYEEAAQITRKEVIDGLLEAALQAKLMGEPSSMVSAWREVGKILGYYAPIKSHVQISVTGNVLIDRLKNLSDAELLALSEAPALEGIATRVETHESEDDDANG